MTAIIIIDLQNDFLSPDGTLGIKHISTDFLADIKNLVEQGRKNGQIIIWIKSIYNKVYVDHTDKFIEYKDKLNKLNFDCGDLFRTHCGKRNFCEIGTIGAEFHEDVIDIIQPGDCIIVKQNYSAFIDTDLDVILKNNNIKNLIITGVTTNKCVMCTCIHAYLLNYDVTIIKSCTKSVDKIKYDKAIEELSTICLIKKDEKN